jgi:succinate-acetate transporter protein
MGAPSECFLKEAEMATPSPTPSPTPQQPVRLVPQVEEPATGPLAGDPAMVGFPSFIVGAVTIGMVLIGVVPATPFGPVAGAAMPIVLTAAVGMFLATIWAARIGHTAAAGISGIVGSFYLSYALLVLGLTHNWYGIAVTQVANTQKIFVISWIAIVSLLLLATLRMPVIWTLLFAVVDAALILNLLGIIQSSANMDKAAGWVLMAVSAIVVYLFFGSASHATGGKELPLGPPILHA